MCCTDLRSEIIYFAVRCGVLQQGTKIIAVADLGCRIPCNHFIAKMTGAGSQYIQCLGQGALINEKPHALVFAVDALEHGHGFRRRGRFIQQRGIGQFHAGQIADHLLEIQHGLQATL